MTRHVPLEQIEERHLRSLCENAVPEGRDLEFKREPYGRGDAEAKEFLKDVSALANTAGGDLIIGIREEEGVAKELVGIGPTQPDQEINRIESLIRDGLEPRLLGVRCQAVRLAEGSHALLIRVPQSWNPPHRVIRGGTSRFYARGSRNSFEMNVEQLRAAFLGSADMERRLTNRRLERLAKVQAGLDIKLQGPGQLVVHIAPLLTLREPLSIVTMRAESAKFEPMNGWGDAPRATLDGLLILGARGDGEPEAYTKVFRDGWVEAAAGRLVQLPPGYQDFVLPHGLFIPRLIRALAMHINGLVLQGVGAPLAIMVSLLGVKGSFLPDRDRSFGFGPARADQSDMIFAPIVLEDTSCTPGWQSVLRPMLDQWWNAYGYDRCGTYFDEHGQWTGKD